MAKNSGMRSYNIKDDKRLLGDGCTISIEIGINEAKRNLHDYTKLIELLNSTIDDFIGKTYYDVGSDTV